MISKINLLLILFLAVQKFGHCQTLASLDKIYQQGVDAYSDDRWSRCIEKFEEALHLYKLYKSVVVNCRLRCNSEKFDSQVKEDIDDLKIFEKYFNKRDCLNKCQEKEFRGVNLNKTLDDSVLHDMQAKRPYEYLHICYFQMRMFQKAASSAFTFLSANPSDETMKSNVKYYLEQPEVDTKEVMDMESDDYVVQYHLARKSYNQNNWAETVASFEEVLKDYFASENNCRVECERQPGQEWSTEFVITISNTIASLLHCRQQCQDKLQSLKYNSGVEFIAEVLNYLQVAYYHLEKHDDAAQAVESFLALMPNDEDMMENLKVYYNHVNKESFTQRSEVIHYKKRDEYEKNLLNIFHQGNKHDIDFNSILSTYKFLK